MSRARLWVIATIILAAIIFLPLRLAMGFVGLDTKALTARKASGTIWSGRLEQARLGRLDLGSLDTSLQPLPLFLGRARFSVERASVGGPNPLTGYFDLGLGRRAIDQLNGTLGITGSSLGGLPIDSIKLDQFSVLFSDGQCRAASGKVQLMLAVRIAGLDLRNGLSGEARCEGRSLLLPLSGQSGMEKLTLTVDSDGQYRARFGIAATDPVTAAALSAAGFSATAEGWYRDIRGQF